MIALGPVLVKYLDGLTEEQARAVIEAECWGFSNAKDPYHRDRYDPELRPCLMDHGTGVESWCDLWWADAPRWNDTPAGQYDLLCETHGMEPVVESIKDHLRGRRFT